MNNLPPGYKQTEVGVIPEDWEPKSIQEFASIKTGPFGTLLKASEYSEGDGVPLISVGEIREGFVRITDDTPRVSEAVTRRLPQYVLRKGDIVFARKGGVERSALIRQLQEGWFLGSDGISIRPLQTCDAEFLALQFRSARVQGWLLQNAIGTTMPSLNQEILRSVAIPLPPTRAEQEAIAETLTDADALIESLEQLLAKKRQLKQGAMQDLLTGRKRLPGFSGAWEVKPLGDLFNFSGGFTASRDQLSSEGSCYLHYGDIHTSKKSFVDVCSEYQDIPKLDIPLKKVASGSLLDDGDVVFVDASEDDEGTSRHVVIINPDKTPFISGLHTIIAKCKTNALEHQYRRYCFQTTAVKAQFRFFAVGTKVSGISKTNIARVTLPLPSVPEQTTISAILSDMDAEIAALEAKLAKARSIKQGMMQELLTGRIRLPVDRGKATE
jgi:type I restriction enzyme S subunit